MKALWLFEKIRDTLEEEILCSECLEQVSHYVDYELDGRPAAALMPHLKQHIDQCKVCHEEYELLRDLAKMQRENRLPSLEALRQQMKPDSF